MLLKKIVCIGFSGQELEENYWHELDVLAESRILADESEAVSKNSDADALLVKLGAKVSAELMNKFPNLKYIGMLGTGYGGVDTEHAKSKGITVTNIAAYATEAVAELTFGMLIEHLRQLPQALAQTKAGTYSNEGFQGTEIKGKKFGVIGLGDIGLRTAELAQAFGAKVSYWSRNRKADAETEGIAYQDIEALLKEADIITLNLVLNPETQKFLDFRLIGLIKPGAILMNLGPIELLDFNALVGRLKQGDLTFMVDYADQMSADQLSALRFFSNCYIYPHLGYVTDAASLSKKRIYINNLNNFLNGQPTNKVN